MIKVEMLGTLVEVNTRDKFSRRDHIETAVVEEDGAIKWPENGHYLMDDTMDNIERNGFVGFSREATVRKREEQNEKFFEEYRRNHKGISEEEKAEMRNAFGEGAVIVDVITGEEIVL